MFLFLKPQICFGGDGGGGGGGGGNDSGGDGSASSGTTPAAVPAPTPVATNSFTEALANFFTPNDGASYVGGQLVDDATNTSIAAGGTSSTGNIIAGTANSSKNDNTIYQDAASNTLANFGIGTGTSSVPKSFYQETPIVQPLGTLENINTVSTPVVATTGTSGALPTTNSTMEELANLLTPDDGAVYANGQLVDQFTGEVIEAGELSSTGDKIYGTANTASNDMADYMGYGSAPVVNTSRETLANIITPGDNAMYVDGQLVNTLTGESLTGGGYTIDPVTGVKDYVYGVSDDFSNNAAVDTTGMTQMQATAAIANQKMRQDIPPSDLAYFGSFFGNSVVPILGGILAEKMLMGGVEDRQAIVDQQTAALEAGATPQYNEAGEYVGFDTSTMTGNVQGILDEFGAEGLLPGGLPPEEAAAENARFQQVFDAQSTSAEADLYGMSTQDGFITSGGTEYYVAGDGSVQEVTDGIVGYDQAKGGESVDSVYDITSGAGTGGGDGGNTSGGGGGGGTNTGAARSIYNRYYKGGSGFGLPAWLRQYASGVSINQLLEKVVIEGKEYFKTPDGKYIEPSELAGTVDLGVEVPAETDE